MQCRPGCGACCIEPSINRPFYGMPAGKPAGVPCIHLDEQRRCRLFGDPRRPDVCVNFAAELSVCGTTGGEAERRLRWLEDATSQTEIP